MLWGNSKKSETRQALPPRGCLWELQGTPKEVSDDFPPTLSWDGRILHPQKTTSDLQGEISPWRGLLPFPSVQAVSLRLRQGELWIELPLCKLWIRTGRQPAASCGVTPACSAESEGGTCLQKGQPMQITQPMYLVKTWLSRKWQPRESQFPSSCLSVEPS